MEPRIQYAHTKDGVSIAYATWGDGMPLVVSNIHLPLAFIGSWWPRSIERLASGRMLVAYDSRGVGLSERNVSDFSLEAFLLDLEAVIAALHQDTLALWGNNHGGPVAIAYAVSHPERVSHLVLWLAYARSSDYLRDARLKAFRALIDQDWDLFVEGLTNIVLAPEGGEVIRRAAADFRESLTPDVLRAIFARSLAAGIPNARLKLLEGSSAGFTDDFVSATDEFLREGLQAAQREPDVPSGTAVILFADIADSTALTERLGDAAFREKARELDGALRTVIREHVGTAIEGKFLGDGVLAVFTSARQAIEAALACASAGGDAGLPLHLGLHAGDVIRDDNNVYGGAVNIAARISGLSAAGEVLVSETVRSLARTSAGVRFEDRGEQGLKGVGEAVRVWAVQEAK